MRAGIRTIIMPEKNKRELSELPRYMSRKIEFVPVKQMSEVLDRAVIGIKSGRKLKKAKSKNK
jgi:ATP-dependent Lon protease